jgi:ketosteroid isomerase-like protein
MKRLFLMGCLATVCLLVACNDETSKEARIAEQESKMTTADQSTVGFEMSNGEVKEETNLSNEEKTAIIQSFNEYIDAFNAQDVERYMATLATKDSNFNLEDERKAAEEAFSTYEIERIAEDVTLTKYDESLQQANVYATLKVNLVERETSATLSSIGRQVTVLSKEDGDWKVASIYYIGEE